jgi:hypothetical protein
MIPRPGEFAKISKKTSDFRLQVKREASLCRADNEPIPTRNGFQIPAPEV